MTGVGQVPEAVVASIAASEAARERARRMQTEFQCAHGCGPAVASRGGGPALCAKHDRGSSNPTPDPLRSEPYLRRTYGVMSTPPRTSFDTRVEASGQRASGARREAAR